jgi:hypothetical protein
VHFYLLQASVSCAVTADDFVEGLLNTSDSGGSKDKDDTAAE